MHVLVTRPEPDAAELKALIEAMGHRASLSPLIAILPTGVPVPLDGVQALIATSRNGLARIPALKDALALPLFTVGPATAEMARALGFSRVHEGTGTARDLVPLIATSLSPEGGDLVHLAGDRFAFDLKGALEDRGFTLRQPVLYKSEAVKNLDPQALEAIRSQTLDGVILMSPRTATIFAELMEKNGLQGASRGLIYFCLSSAVAQGLAGLAPQDARVAEAPTLQELLALLARVAPEST